jgi:N-acetylneuraminate epimerase
MVRQLIFFIIMFSTLVSSAQNKSVPSIKWQVVSVLPPSTGQSECLGFAGAINGVSNNVFIVAGGANFPDGLPWEGGKKYYSNEIHILQKKNGKYVWNKKIKQSLPQPIAYCGATSTDKGIVYVGGENENGISKKCYLLNWKAEKSTVDVRALPDLPLALTNVAVTHIDTVIFAAGGDEAKTSSNSFFSLDLNDVNPTWKTLPALPIALANALSIAQNEKYEKEIFIIGGRTKAASGISDLHNTVFAFDPLKQTWRKCADISDGKKTTNLSAASGVALDEDKILIAGGDNGEIFHQIETYIAAIAKAKTPEEKAKLTNEKNNLSIHHKGFDKSILLYNTNSNVWTKIGELPFPAQVTTNAVIWGNDIVISNGEIKPGIRTPDIIIGEISSK